MRVLRRDIKHDTITVMPEVLDDFWVLYNIIQKGDTVHARTRRQIKVVERYDRPEKGKRITVSLGVSVERVMWDRYLNRLRVHGIVCEDPRDIGLAGARHTLNIVLNKPLKIVKDRWMKYQLDQLYRATKRNVPPVTVMSIDDEGYCVAVLRGFGLDIRVEENIALPGKSHADERAGTLKRLLKSASKALEAEHAETRAPIVVLGIGFIKNHFLKHLQESMPEVRGKVIDVKSVNSAGKAGIYEAIRSGILSKALRHVRISDEAGAVEEVLRRLGKEQRTVTYGLADVEQANTLGAIDEVLLTDLQLREASDEERQVLESLMREVEKKRGKVLIISTEHEAGAKLHSLGGIAALLRFPTR